MPLDARTHIEQPEHRGPCEPPFFPGTDLADLTDLNLFRAGHPLDHYKRLREQAPIYFHEERSIGEPGFWAVSTYDHVKHVSLDHESFSSEVGGINMSYGGDDERHPLLSPASINNLITMDAFTHFELRTQHMPFFNQRYLKSLRQKIESKVVSLLEDMAKKRPKCNLVEEFSSHLPLYTLSELLGIPESDRLKLVQWMDDLEMAFYLIAAKNGYIDLTADLIDAYDGWDERISAFFDYGAHMLKLRKENPKDDLLSAIANACVENEELPDPFLAGSWLLIFIAGNDTTRNSLSGMMNLLSQFPAQKTKLLANRDRLPNAIQEAVRMVSPVIYMKRTTIKDTMIGEQKLKAGEKVILYYGSANRDESIFENPDIYDIERDNAGDHLAFGVGKHVCLGKHLALMQLELAYEKIFEKFPNIEVDGELECAPNNFVHAITKLPVKF